MKDVLLLPCKVEKALFGDERRVSLVLNGHMTVTVCSVSCVSGGSLKLPILRCNEDGSFLVSVPGQIEMGYRSVTVSPNELNVHDNAA